jgi:hypothetical protein
MADVTVHLRRNLARYEREGDTERVKRIKARLAELESAPEAPSMSSTKDELLAAAASAGVTVDESMTKAEILDAMEGN